MFPDVKWCGRKIRLVAALRAPRRARSACFAIGCVVMLLVVIAIILGAIVLSRGLLMIPLMSAMSARRRARRVATRRVARPDVSCIWLRAARSAWATRSSRFAASRDFARRTLNLREMRAKLPRDCDRPSAYARR